MESAPKARVGKTQRPAIDVDYSAKQQAWLNLQVWLPFLMNPRQHQRMVKYAARESRQGGVWSLLLPQQCWECATTQEVQAREYACTFRGFDQMVRLLAIGGTFAFCLLVAAVIFMHPIPWLMFLGVLLLMLVIGFLKSWKESVRLITWSCKAHDGQMPMPEMALADEELHLFLATPEMAEHARKALIAQRRSGGKYTQEQAPPAFPTESTDLPKKAPGKPPTTAGGEDRGGNSSTQPTIVPAREQLPTIKLDDDLFSE